MAKPALPKLHKAVRFAAKAHKRQDRDGKSPLPYVTHPIEVLSLVRYQADVVDEEILCAAALHDIVEETEYDLSDIADRFGSRVAGLVKELTREEPETMGLPEAEVAKIRNSVMMAEIDRMSDEAKIIKLADRCSNLAAAFKSKTGDKLQKYIKQSREILDHIDRKICPPLWDRINEMVEGAEPERNGAKRKAVSTAATRR